MLITIMVLGFVFPLLILIGIKADENSWNNGVCEECNTEWVYFGTDSQGTRGYKCSCKERHTTWISYGVDKIKCEK